MHALARIFNSNCSRDLSGFADKKDPTGSIVMLQAVTKPHPSTENSLTLSHGILEIDCNKFNLLYLYICILQ